MDELLDKPSSIMILNNSRWSVVEAIDKSNKDALLQQLIFEEVIVRREANIRAFKHGMSLLNVSSLLEDYPTLMRPLLVAEGPGITSQIFKSLIKSRRPDRLNQAAAYDMFLDFVEFIGGKKVLPLPRLPCGVERRVCYTLSVDALKIPRYLGK